jgi:hypothetical protein
VIRAKYVTVRHATASGVADRWLNSYFRNDKWIPIARGSSEAVHKALCALGDTPDLAKVADVIGNKSWSYLRCEGCSDYVERAVCLGEAEYDTKTYCEQCVREAAHALLGEGAAA